MIEAMQKFKNTLDETETIAIRIGENHDIGKTLVAKILHASFLKLGKKSNLEFDGNTKISDFLKVFFKEENTKLPENVLIKLDTKNLPVEELKYEKEGDILKLILRGNGEIKTENIEIVKEKAAVDLLMLVDTPEKETDEILAETPHKDVVRFSDRPNGIALKTYDMVVTFFGKIPDEFATPFWALFSLEEKKLGETNEELSVIKTNLLKLGADQQKINGAFETLKGLLFEKLLGRALLRSEFEPELKTFWSFLSKKDFESSNETADNSSFLLLRELENIKPQREFTAFLVEKKPEEISAIISSKNRSSTERAAELLGAEIASAYIFVNGFKTFSEAELKIRSVLKKVLLQ
ncbi:hypothetical protein HYS99_00465 [Candidatus Giovannonibacteria bacterium]|nr:hypothetical protein [Candidatus Giovannonibacteria bacterium]